MISVKWTWNFWDLQHFFSKCYQICSFLRILWHLLHLLKKSLMENFIFCTVQLAGLYSVRRFSLSTLTILKILRNTSSSHDKKLKTGNSKSQALFRLNRCPPFMFETTDFIVWIFKVYMSRYNLIMAYARGC